MSNPLAIQSGRPCSEIAISPKALLDVRQAYLVTMRQRFKSEINRLNRDNNRGDMLKMLKKQKSSHGDAENLSFLMTYVYAFNWLQQNLHTQYRKEVLAAFSRGPQAFLMQMLLKSDSTTAFIQAYITYWQHYSGEAQLQQHQLLSLLQIKGTPEALADYIENCWNDLQLFGRSFTLGYRDLARQEKDRYSEMLGTENKERLALIDTLPDTTKPTRFAKLGIIPAMGCPQTCRHCMFIFRPLMHNTKDPAQLYEIVDELTTSVLFTGGDLTQHLEHFYCALSTMRNITTFAILLNGDFADSREVA
ncbi:hypothetical protein MNBD_GAMMA11-1527, partial [hydrothermal vent metagenome]